MNEIYGLMNQKPDRYTTQYSNGLIDDVYIFNRLLSEVEIGLLFEDNPLCIRTSIGPSISSPYSLFPNPSSGMINIKREDSEGAEVDVSITDIQGRTVFRNNWDEGLEKTIDLSKQGQGVYFLKVIDGDKTFVKKVVLE